MSHRDFPVTSMTSVSPSQRPLDVPIHAGTCAFRVVGHVDNPVGSGELIREGNRVVPWTIWNGNGM